MSYQDPGFRPSGWDIAGDHEQRIGILEAIPPEIQLGGPGNDYPGLILTSTDLRGYWRLGEASGNWLDTSGYIPADPANMTLEHSPGGVALTRHVAGAIIDDDGAVTFNFAGDGTDLSTNADYMDAVNVTNVNRFRFSNSDGRDMSVAAWIKPGTNANTVRGCIVGNTDVLTVGGTREVGWGLQMTWPNRKVRMSRCQNAIGGLAHYAESSTALTAGTWYFVVGTYDGATIRLYVDGALAASTADTRDIASAQALRIGGGYTVPDDHASSNFGFFYGGVDEVAVWSDVLTPTEIDLLYRTGNDLTVPAGQVYTSDGAGNAYWAYPTIQVEY